MTGVTKYSEEIDKAIKAATIGPDLSKAVVPEASSNAIAAAQGALNPPLLGHGVAPDQTFRDLYQLGYRDVYGSPARDILDQIGSTGSPQPPRTSPPVPAKVTASHPAQCTSAVSAGAAITGVADIGKCVREARKTMGMTQQRFADLAGVGRRFLIELEHGKPSLEIGRVLAVCRAAGIRMGFLP